MSHVVLSDPTSARGREEKKKKKKKKKKKNKEGRGGRKKQPRDVEQTDGNGGEKGRHIKEKINEKDGERIEVVKKSRAEKSDKKEIRVQNLQQRVRCMRGSEQNITLALKILFDKLFLIISDNFPKFPILL